jgi:hypothetical protein
MNRPSSQRLNETIFYCFPLRLGIFVCALTTFFSSFVYDVDRLGWDYLFRYFVGGYSQPARFFLGVIQFTGMFGGWAGLIGTWFVQVSYVQGFYYWQLFRILAMCAVYAFDMPLLANCEGWVNTVNKMQDKYGWNGLMYDIAVTGRCPSDRERFFVWTSFTAVLFMYIFASTGRYIEAMDQTPRHLLRVPKDLPSGAYYSYATGDRSYMQGNYGSQDIRKDTTPFEGILPEVDNRNTRSPMQV